MDSGRSLRFDQSFLAEGVQTVAGCESLCCQTFVETRVHPKHKLPAKSLPAGQQREGLNAISMQQLEPLLHGFAKLDINPPLVGPMNGTDKYLRASLVLYAYQYSTR